jgi:hypothetical protein
VPYKRDRTRSSGRNNPNYQVGFRHHYDDAEEELTPESSYYTASQPPRREVTNFTYQAQPLLSADRDRTTDFLVARPQRSSEGRNYLGHSPLRSPTREWQRVEPVLPGSYLPEVTRVEHNPIYFPREGSPPTRTSLSHGGEATRTNPMHLEDTFPSLANRTPQTVAMGRVRKSR